MGEQQVSAQHAAACIATAHAAELGDLKARLQHAETSAATATEVKFALQSELAQKNLIAQQVTDRARIVALEQQLHQAQAQLQQGVTATAVKDDRIAALEAELHYLTQQITHNAVAQPAAAHEVATAVQTAAEAHSPDMAEHGEHSEGEHSPEQAAGEAMMVSQVNPIFDSDGVTDMGLIPSGEAVPAGRPE